MSETEVRFPVPREGEGYPPTDWEWIWCQRTEYGTFMVDNVPFFARDVSFGDEIEAENQEGLLTFKAVIEKSTNSTIRVMVHNQERTPAIREEIDRLGCQTELSDIPGLFAVSMPLAHAEKTLECLDRLAESSVIGFEEAAVRYQ